ncbi:hypothetical protein D3C74_389810 [compost metagenome]
MDFPRIIVQLADNAELYFVQITEACQSDHPIDPRDAERQSLVRPVERFIRFHYRLQRLGKKPLFRQFIEGNASHERILHLSFAKNRLDAGHTFLLR